MLALQRKAMFPLPSTMPAIYLITAGPRLTGFFFAHLQPRTVLHASKTRRCAHAVALSQQDVKLPLTLRWFRTETASQRAGPREPTQERRHPGVPATAAPPGDSERSAFHPAFPDRHREALARVPPAEGRGAVPQQGGASRRHQERERAGDERELGAADGLRSIQAHVFAGEEEEEDAGTSLSRLDAGNTIVARVSPGATRVAENVCSSMVGVKGPVCLLSARFG